MKSHLHFPHSFTLRFRGIALTLMILGLPLLLGAWKEFTSQGINRHYVSRIQDGKTKKAEILIWFGDPLEIKRTPEGVTYIYKTFRAKPTSPRREPQEIVQSADTPYHLEEKFKPKPKKETSSQEVASSLTIHFQPDGDKVQSHEYKEF
ncbi:MAG: hypothetical protein ACUVXF_03765 [Desulfobaccales bacterium]